MSCKWFIADNCTHPDRDGICVNKLRDCDYEEHWGENCYEDMITVSRKVYGVYSLEGTNLRLIKLFEEFSDADVYCKEVQSNQKKVFLEDNNRIKHIILENELVRRRVVQ